MLERDGVGGEARVLYGAAVLLSIQVVWIFAKLIGGGRRARTCASVLVAGCAQVRFVIDTPIEGMLQSMNVTYQLAAVPSVPSAETVGSAVALTVVHRVGMLHPIMPAFDAVLMIHWLDGVYDEIATAGILQSTLRNAWSYPFTTETPFHFDSAAARAAARAPFGDKPITVVPQPSRPLGGTEYSHLAMVAPPLRLLGGMEVEPASPIQITVDVDARRKAKGYRGNVDMMSSHFRAMVRSWQPIDGSANLCCAHALLGVALRPQILELYGSLISQLELLGSESTAANDLRKQVQAHLTPGDMPTAPMFRRRHDQMQSALAIYESTGRAPGIRQGEGLADCSYLGSFTDHIALFSSAWGEGRCHLVVESMPDEMVNVQKWESIASVGHDLPMHRSVSAEEVISLVSRYGNRLTCARMDHGFDGGSGLRSGYHHYAASYTLHGPTTGNSNGACECDDDVDMASGDAARSGA